MVRLHEFDIRQHVWFCLILVCGYLLCLLPLQVHAADTAQPAATAKHSPIAIAVHGGAGAMQALNDRPEAEQQFLDKLSEAVDLGYRKLKQSETSLQAAIAAVQVLESSDLFNAGVGAVYTWDEQHELDASVMDGATLQAGAVAGVKTVASPIALAQAVMLHSPHVLLTGRGAEAFARSQGIPMVDNSMFSTPARLQALRRAKAAQAQHGQLPVPAKWGTVGAVALDHHGNLAAATSTGGMTAKRWGRVGDSPLIGAGTYADNRSCAVSATGHGEYFIRYNVAADICARVRYQGLSIEQAGKQVVFEELLPAGGTGGVIILDPQGRVSMPFNTPAMFRAAIDRHGQRVVGIGKD